MDEILPKNMDEDVAFLVVGDPFGATTHTDLVLRAKEKNIQVTRDRNICSNRCQFYDVLLFYDLHV